MALTDQLLAWYRNNGTDTSGNGNNLSGTVTQGTGFNGAANAAMVFSGSGVLQRTAIFSTTNWSIAFWYKVAAGAYNIVFVSQLNDDFITRVPFTSGGNDTGGTDGLNTEAGVRDLGGFTGATTGTGVTANTWFHFAATYDGTTALLYKNGTQVATATVSLPAISSSFPNAFKIGQGDGTAPAAPYAQWVGCWSRALSGSEVSSLYNGGTGFDPTAVSPPVNTVAPAVTPSPATVGQACTCTTGTWTGSPTSYSYQWKLDGSNVGTDSSSYTPVAAGTLTCTVTASNAGGAGTPAVSNSVTVSSGGTAPFNTVAPSVTPSTGIPATSFAFNAGTWTGTDGYPITYTWTYRKRGAAAWLTLSTSQNPTIAGTVFGTQGTYDTQVTARNDFGSTTVNGPSVTLGETRTGVVNPMGFFGL